MAIPAPGVFEAFYQQRKREEPQLINDMLGMWVSELEPVLAVDWLELPLGLIAEQFATWGLATRRRITVTRDDVVRSKIAKAPDTGEGE